MRWFLNRKAYAIIPYMVCDVYLKFKRSLKKSIQVTLACGCKCHYLLQSASSCKLSRPQNKHRLIANSIQESALSTSKFTPLSYEMKRLQHISGFLTKMMSTYTLTKISCQLKSEPCCHFEIHFVSLVKATSPQLKNIGQRDCHCREMNHYKE